MLPCIPKERILYEAVERIVPTRPCDGMIDDSRRSLGARVTSK
jgi:hypothetical protein